MTLEQLRIFLAVAEHLHFTRAATALFITQPAVSAAIQTLERSYGSRLFHRLGRRVELTEAGRWLQTHAQQILDQVHQLEQGLRELNQLQMGELHLGSSLTIGNYWLPYRISTYKQRYPGIRVHCTLANTEAIGEGVLRGDFDLGLVEGVVRSEDQTQLEQRIIGWDRLCVIVGPKHPWFHRREVSIAELTTTDWIVREPGSGTQQHFEAALAQWGIPPESLSVILQLQSGEMVKALVSQGSAAAAISEMMIRNEVRLGDLQAVPLTSGSDALQRPFLLLKHRQRYTSRAAQAFEDLLEQVVAPSFPP
ncbi:LysR family transcriptional regulator [Thermostichus vulcanus]|uniref:LysR family transcriptional regulator n=1 Tax=Thermostichus vulcanus str. 'Rupite' TaxID=2813851 RepID=A0ABT0CDJ0_THEVL|nr:LysR family transcriptional regulator [Thermostichus vulcanus]MCJ2543841.1 LysR family transcriptional regulator [Thermostichus vulcanus str. 'Rupite']